MAERVGDAYTLSVCPDAQLVVIRFPHATQPRELVEEGVLKLSFHNPAAEISFQTDGRLRNEGAHPLGLACGSDEVCRPFFLNTWKETS